MEFNLAKTTVAILVLVVAGLAYSASERLGSAGQSSSNALETTLHSHRIAQSLKSLTSGYELAMNEYYSTVLAFPAYHQKATEHQAAIERELGALSRLDAGNPQAVEALNRALQEMGAFRQALETALASDDKDWDAAREALYKLNVVSVRAIQQADILARVAEERATSLDKEWRERQNGAQTLLRSTLLGALAAFALMLIFSLRARKA